MRTKTINKDSNIIRITFNKVPQTGTMSKLSAALDLIDSSVNAICDARITEALDTSSIQELWSRFQEFDFVTAAALSDLDYRINVTDSSLGVFNSQNLTKFDEVNSSLSDLSNAIVGVRNDLNQHIIDTSDISGTVKPEDIAEYLQPLYSGIADVSTRLKTQITAVESAIADNTTLINNVSSNLTVTRSILSDVSTRLTNHLNDYNITNSSVNSLTTLVSSIDSLQTEQTTAIANINASISALVVSTVANASIWNNQAAPNIRALNTSVNDISTRLKTQITAVESAIVDNTTLIQNVSSNLTVTRSILTDVSTRLSNHLTASDTTNSSVNNLTNLVTAIDSLQTEQTTAINNINASISALVVSTVNNTSIWNNQAAPNIRVLNTSVNDISTRLANHLNDYVNINSSLSDLTSVVSQLDNATVNALTALNTSVRELYNASQTQSYIVLSNDVSTLRNTVSGNTNSIDNINASIDQINTSLGLNGYFDHIRDVSINTLDNYVHTTVDSLLTSYTQRLNSTESIAVDAMAVSNDVSTHFAALNNNVNYIVDNFNSSIYSRFDEIDSSINATIDERFAVINSSLADYQTNINSSFADYQTNINSSFSNYQNYIDSSLIGWGEIIEERDFVISRALTQLDTSIVWLINRLTALQQS